MLCFYWLVKLQVPPGKPTVAVVVSGRDVAITWTASAANGNTVVDYEVKLLKATGAITRGPDIISASSTLTMSYTALDGGFYRANVRARNDKDQWSDDGYASFTIEASMAAVERAVHCSNLCRDAHVERWPLCVHCRFGWCRTWTTHGMNSQASFGQEFELRG